MQESQPKQIDLVSISHWEQMVLTHESWRSSNISSGCICINTSFLDVSFNLLWLINGFGRVSMKII